MNVRRRRALTALVGALFTLAATACTGSPAVAPGPDPEPAVAAFAAAWQGLKADPIAALTDDPGAAAQEAGSVLHNLAPGKLSVTATNVRKTSDLSATATATFAWTLAGGINWKYTANWAFARTSPQNGWKASWAATMINPQLGDAQSVALRSVDASSGSILDRNNQQILSPTRIYSVVALPDKIPDRGATAAALARILGPLDPTVTAASVIAGLKPATAATGYTVTSLREEEYQQVRSQLDTVAGLSMPTSTRNLPATKDFAREVLSEVQPVAKKLMQGTAGWEIDAVDATGAELETLASQPARPGANVVLTLDSAVQKAAEAALAGYLQPTVLVAIQPSTGEILAVAQNQPANALGPIALTGRYPPGSTFKIVTATAGFEQSLVTPTTQVDCPGMITVDSRDIHNNTSFELGMVSVTTAFAESCNTTFAKLATEMPADALTKAAYQYGVGRDFVVPGITTLTGKVPVADSTVQKAENGFGQGVVLVTPFGQALMAATAANGAMPMPTLIRGTRTTVDQPVVPRSAATASAIRTLMRAVVTDGTASKLQGAGEVYAKTGTADFIDTDGKDRAHAWTVGYRGDLAFSVLIVAGNSSQKTTLIADKFLGVDTGPLTARRLDCMLRTAIRPGTPTPIRPVPASIPRPEYVGRPRPAPSTDPWVQTDEVVEKMRVASRIAAQALAAAGAAVAPGVTTDQLDRIVHEYICDAGAYPSTLGYRNYPKSCCTSLNEVICHGIPDTTVIQDGDIVNIDVTAYIGGVHGDTNATFLAGDVSEENRLLVERTEESLRRAIKAVAPGRQLNVVGRVIESYAKRFGYGVVRDYTGHGIGRTFHSGLVVLHYDDPSVTTVLEKGMTFTIEPMITLGGIDWDLWDDDWTVTTRDKSWTAQFEHTLVVTDTGAEILTLP